MSSSSQGRGPLGSYWWEPVSEPDRRSKGAKRGEELAEKAAKQINIDLSLSTTHKARVVETFVSAHFGKEPPSQDWHPSTTSLDFCEGKGFIGLERDAGSYQDPPPLLQIPESGRKSEYSQILLKIRFSSSRTGSRRQPGAVLLSGGPSGLAWKACP